MSLGGARVLVTGGGGWLGRALLRVLREGVSDGPEPLRVPPACGARITCLERPGVSPVAGVEWLTGDLRVPADCARLCAEAPGAVLFHLAGVIHPRRARAFEEVNVGGTQNLLDAALAGGVRRAVVVSSSSVCGANPHPDHLFDEASPCRPYMSYGRSKMRQELCTRAFDARGLETVILRMPWFYGPNQPPRQTELFRRIRDGRLPLVAGGRARRSMTYVDNAAQGLLLAATTPGACGRTYWIADAEPYSLREVVATVRRVLETELGIACSRRSLWLPGLVSDLAEVGDAGLQALGLYDKNLHVLSEMNKTIACSIARARRELAYAPSVDLEEGMRRSLRWVLETQGGL